MLLTDIERAVLDMLLAGDHPALATLRQQLATSDIRSRDYTGVGFFTEFSVPQTAPLLEGPQNFRLSDVSATLSGVEHGAGFILFVQEGRIDFLECFTYDGQWPENPKLLEAFYLAPTKPRSPSLVRTDRRDFETLRNVLAGYQASAPDGTREVQSGPL